MKTIEQGVRFIIKASMFLLLTLSVIVPSVAVAKGNAERGEKIVKSRKLGNCMACHFIPGVEFPGNIGPNLVESMKNYSDSDREMVRQWVWDARAYNPDTIMPPFGPNKILTKDQIEDVVEYLYSLKKIKK
jgi:sulfur-oxidizing protein SoxX